MNKVSTKVELRLLLEQTSALNPGQKARLRARFASQITREGELVLTCDEQRSQAQNLEAARDRLRSMILSVRLPPKPRRETRPTRASKERRLDAKKQRSTLKKLRNGRFD